MSPDFSPSWRQIGATEDGATRYDVDITRGQVVAVNDDNTWQVQELFRRDADGNPVVHPRVQVQDPTYEPIVGDSVQLGRQKPAHERVFILNGGALGSLLVPVQVALLQWVMQGRDQRRTGYVPPPSLAFNAATQLRTEAGMLLRSWNGLVLIVGASQATLLSPLHPTAATPKSVTVAQAMYDETTGTLLVVNGNTITTFSSSCTQLATHAYGSALLALEPVVVGGELLLLDSHSATAWALMDMGNLGSIKSALPASPSASVSIPWAGWTSASDLPHHSVGVSYPIPMMNDPYTAALQVLQPIRLQPIVTSAGTIVLPGTDSTFMQAVLDERNNPAAYQDVTPHNYGRVDARSQIQCWGPSGLVWSIGAEALPAPPSATVRSYAGLNPVVANPTGDRVFAHWERSDWQTSPAFSQYAPNLMVSTKYYLASDADFLGQHTWPGGSEGAQIGPWEDWMSAGWIVENYPPVWGYDLASGIQKPTATGTILSDMIAVANPYQPTSGYPWTWISYGGRTASLGTTYQRDYQSGWTHGMVAVNAATGEVTATAEFSTADASSPRTTWLDTGDPAYLSGGHAPSPMVTGTRQVDITISGQPTGTLASYAALGPNDHIQSYAAVESFSGDSWLCADGVRRGGPGQPPWYQGHSWWGVSMADGSLTTWGTPPTIWTDFTDLPNGAGNPGGQFSHHTIAVTYHCWVVTTQSLSLQYADVSYGFDPHNTLTDGANLYLLPRHVYAMTSAPTYYPPTSVQFGDGGGPTTLQYNVAPLYWLGSTYDCPWSAEAAASQAGRAEAAPIGVRSCYDAAATSLATWETHGRNDLLWELAKDVNSGPPNYSTIYRTYAYAPMHGYYWDGCPVDYTRLTGATIAGSTPYSHGTGHSGSALLNFVPLVGSLPDPTDNQIPLSLRGTGSAPKGGSWSAPGTSWPFWSGGAVLDLKPPIPPGSEMLTEILCLDTTSATLAQKWRVSLGQLDLTAQPVGVLSGGKIYLLVAGTSSTIAATIYQIDCATGQTGRTITIPGSAPWRFADLIAAASRLLAAGDTGTYAIA